MGIVHILTGPDHLSALATLSANVDKSLAFWYGIRWGIGHSIGLIVVGSTFILLSSRGRQNDADGDDDGDGDGAVEIPEKIETICEVFVGFFMLALGCYSLMKAFQKGRNAKHGEEGHANASGDEEMTNDVGGRVGTNGKEDDSPLQYTLGEASLSLADVANPNASSSSKTRPEIIEGHGHGHSHLPNMQDGISKQFLTIGIGIVHGVAGPGGVLGVIPAVQLHNPWLSTVYLGSFCVTSTLVMGCFAAMYGECSSRVSQNSETLAFRMEVFSASLSVLVGCLWLILLYLGILDEVFP